MHDIGEPVPDSRIVTSLPEAWDFARSCGFPLIIRPAYTLGGSGGGVARHEDEFEAVVTQGLQTSPIRQVLVRSEEHTSELQSLVNLVCRLLLEKKNTKTTKTKKKTKTTTKKKKTTISVRHASKQYTK